MRTLVSYILFLLLIAGPRLWAQTSSSTSELEQLKSLVAIQQRALEQQQTDIQALQLSLAEQKEILASVMPHSTRGAALVPAVSRVAEPSSDYHVTADVQTPPQGDQAMPSDQEPTPAKQEAVEEELQRGPEIADVTPDTPALQLGPAKIRFIGYTALTGVFRSTNSGGNVGTSFASLPFDNTVPGNTSEFRLSAQSTRLALRADADLNSSKVAGYFEMDFGGAVPGNVAVTSTSYGFRIRQAWFDYSNGKFEITGRQLFSLMTPVKKNILPWPGDASITQVI